MGRRKEISDAEFDVAYGVFRDTKKITDATNRVSLNDNGDALSIQTRVHFGALGVELTTETLISLDDLDRFIARATDIRDAIAARPR